MIQDFLLPDLGEGLAEAEVVQWLVAEGDTVALNQTIAEVETAKAVVELPSPFAGSVHHLHAGVGDTVEVGAPLVSFAVPDDEPADVADVRPSPAETPAASAPAPTEGDSSEREPRDESPAVPNLVGYGAAASSSVRPHRRRRPGPAGGVAPDTAPDRPVEPARASEALRETRTPIRGVRRRTADAMVRSAFTAPHASTTLQVDVTETTTFLASLGRDRALDGHRIGILAVTAKAVCLALRRTPDLGSRWDEDADEIVVPAYVNLGIAVATDRGLLVPHVADADRLSLVDLADAIGGLVDTARRGRTAPGEFVGGTFTITNVGVFGVDAGTPILNPGEAGILALGAVRSRPWEHAGEIALRDVVTLTLSFDHRLVDGSEAARFLTDVGGVLREPGRALLF